MDTLVVVKKKKQKRGYVKQFSWVCLQGVEDWRSSRCIYNTKRGLFII